jgi:hypothetical protein
VFSNPVVFLLPEFNPIKVLLVTLLALTSMLALPLLFEKVVVALEVPTVLIKLFLKY